MIAGTPPGSFRHHPPRGEHLPQRVPGDRLSEDLSRAVPHRFGAGSSGPAIALAGDPSRGCLRNRHPKQDGRHCIRLLRDHACRPVPVPARVRAMMTFRFGNQPCTAAHGTTPDSRKPRLAGLSGREAVVHVLLSMPRICWVPALLPFERYSLGYPPVAFIPLEWGLLGDGPDLGAAGLNTNHGSYLPVGRSSRPLDLNGAPVPRVIHRCGG